MIPPWQCGNLPANRNYERPARPPLRRLADCVASPTRHVDDETLDEAGRQCDRALPDLLGRRAPQSATEDLGRGAVGGPNPRRIDAERGHAAASMAEAAGDGAKVDAGGEKFGR